METSYHEYAANKRKKCYNKKRYSQNALKKGYTTSNE